MRELSMEEVGQVSGGRMLEAAQYFTAMVTVGGASFGLGWGAVTVGTAIAAAPIAVAAMAGLAFLGGAALVRN